MTAGWNPPAQAYSVEQDITLKVVAFPLQQGHFWIAEPFPLTHSCTHSVAPRTTNSIQTPSKNIQKHIAVP